MEAATTIGSTANVATAKTAPTKYVVLAVKHADDGELEHYELVHSNVPANSDQAAIKAVAPETGTYLAIPERSFKPTKVTVSTETVVKLG